MMPTESTVKLEDQLRKIESDIEFVVQTIALAKDRRDTLISERERIRRAIVVRDWKPNATITSDCPNPRTYGADLAYAEGDRVFVHPNGTTTRLDGESFSSWVTEGRVHLDENPL